ncbi:MULTISPECIES: EAL domain-containing protein [unclassified Synechocystis]|uniref:EAL domain-containing protein n=1 Tax=unclassified Synechocystis TaxID=2640012 RepID=UPI00041EDEE3|nr:MULTISPECIES: EAL domain-containing protein [unclassified Synechocystis]AIE73387.1 diguanylate cyclase/phosphodiesterase (GGDEF & EAL domains) with PAS/PAC sensor(s) [Synechocystis sp. PCC 6714]
MNIWSLFKFPPVPWWVAKQRSLVESPLSHGFWTLGQTHQHQQKQIATNLEHPQQREIEHLKRRLAATEAAREELAQELSQYHRQRLPSSPSHASGLQRALARLGQWGMLSRDLYEFFDQATELICATLGVDYCGIWELLPNRSALLLCAGNGWEESLVGNYTIDATNRSYAGYTIQHNGDRRVEEYEPIIELDLRISQKFRASPLLHNLGIISGINLMVAGPRTAFGVLGVYSLTIRKFTEEEIEFLTVASHILAAAIDRQEYEERLLLLQQAIDASSNGILIADALGSDNLVVYANQGFETITGFNREEVIGQNCRFLLNEDRQGEQNKQLEKLRTAIAHGQECEVVLKNYRKDGAFFWNHLYLSPIYNQQNFLVNFIGIQTDVTQQKLAEQQLRASEEFFSSMIVTITDGLLIVDQEGIIQFVNPAAKEMFKRREHELLQQPFGIPFVANQVTEITLTPPDGSLVVAEMRVSSIHWQKGKAFLVSLRDITEQYQARHALAESEKKYRHIVELTSEGIWILDQEQQTIFANQQLADMLGYSVQEILDKNITAFVLAIHHLPESEQEHQECLQSFPSCVLPNHYQVYDVQLQRRDGSVLWGLVSRSAWYDEWGNYRGELVMLTDITARKSVEQALSASEQRLEGILGSIQDVVWSADAVSFATLYLNPATAIVYGQCLQTCYQSKNFWFEGVHPGDRPLLECHLQLLMEKGHTELEYRIIQPAGKERWLFRRSQLVRDNQDRPIRIDGIDSDITERKSAAEKLHYNANHDPLTNLPNRLLFLDRLGHALQRNLRRQEFRFAVLFLDLDGFKIINDSLGHSCGDLLLQGIAHRLRQCLRPEDTLARLGGDEFTMLIENITCPEDVVAIAQRIHYVLQKPFNLKGQEIFTNTSIGIALNHAYYRHPQDILRDADTAMYRAKAAGKGRYAIFNQTMHHHAVQRLQRENDLRRAIDRHELRLHYQPIVCLKTGQLQGVEALLRWQHPEEGLLLPGEFVAIAEETGLIVPMGDWILWEASQQILKLKQHFPRLPYLQVSVNVSVRQLRDQRIIQTVDEILATTNLAPQDLKLEITESLLIDNLDLAADVLLNLRRRNIQISLDDFGTGYSSLSYLHRFPITTLKVDRSFVNAMEPNDQNTAIVHTIVTLAHTLGLDVIAEGIETEKHLTQLHWLGCDGGQGYYFAQPIPSEKLIDFLALQMPQWLIPAVAE